MDCHHYITELPERKRGQHLHREERGVIQALKQQGLSNRAIARELGCSPTTIGNELRRGTPPRKSNKERAPSTVKRCIVQIGSAAGNRISCLPAERLYPGLLFRPESISGLWMPASVTQGGTDCSPKARWCVLAHSTAKRGQAIYPLVSRNFQRQ